MDDTNDSTYEEKSDEPPLLTMFGSPGRVRILRALLQTPSESLTVSEMEDRIDLHKSTIYRNMDQLVDLGVVTQVEDEGSQIHFTLNEENSIAKALRSIERAIRSNARGDSVENNYTNEMVEAATRNILDSGQEAHLEEREVGDTNSEELSPVNVSPTTAVSASDADLNYYRSRFTDIVIGRERARSVLEAIARLNQNIFSKTELTNSIDDEIDLITVTQYIKELKTFGVVVGIPKVRRPGEEYLRRVPSIIKWLQNLSDRPTEQPAGRIIDYLTHFQRSPVHNLEPEDIDPIEAHLYACLTKGILFEKQIPRIQLRAVEPIQDETWPDTYGYRIAARVDTDYSIQDSLRLQAALETECRWIIEASFYETGIESAAISDSLNLSVDTDNDGLLITGEIEPQFKL